MTTTNLEDMRREYTREALDREHLKENPFDQFALWFEQACKAGVQEPNAMSLATASADAKPSVRTVLLKHFDERGFVFFTNMESKKARQISENANVALLFPWLALERQLIISGVAEKISGAEALKYFLKRPRESQLSAWASPQSRVIESRKFLEIKIEEMKRKFADGKIPLPSFWGGFRIVPHEFEFWQGGANRVHDRFLYSRGLDHSWKIERLAS
jgi:pyridoxamine 5'-phosphate oxidase